MREILFRGKCVEVGIYHERWLEGFYTRSIIPKENISLYMMKRRLK